MLRLLDKYPTLKVSDQLNIYELIPASAYQKFSIEIFDLKAEGRLNSHYHKVQTQVITVLEGQLRVILEEGVPQILNVFQTITIPPSVVHHLEAHGQDNVRFICINSPAFAYPEDVYQA